MLSSSTPLLATTGPMAAAALAARAGPAAARGFITIVHQGSEAYRTALGRNPTLLPPGLHLALPVYHEVHHVDMREGGINIHDLQAFTKDNVPVSCSGTLFYRVTDSYKATFGVQDMYASVKNVGTSSVRSVVGTAEYDEIISDRRGFNDALCTAIGATTEPWGVATSKFELQDFRPTSKEVERQLELQMEAERKRREQLLNTEARVNVADGERRAAVLQSEGSMISAKNEAEGLLQATRMRAEGDIALREAHGRGVASEIEAVAAALGGDTEAASQFLLEMARLEHLRGLAEGANNTTYFLDPAGVLPAVRTAAEVTGLTAAGSPAMQALGAGGR